MGTEIQTNHVEYDKFLPVWWRCDDAVDGSDAIKAKTTKYLPMLPGTKRSSDSKELYSLFIGNALWYPGTGRTYSAYLGTMFRKDAVAEMPAAMEDAEEVFTPDGQTIDGFAVELSGEVVKGYRPGILVDLPDIDTEGMSVAEAQAAGARPFSLLYPAKNIVNWERSLINGHLVTTHVVLEEMVTIDKAKGKYAIEGETRQLRDVDGYAILRRDLSLTSVGGMRVYQQKLYAQTENSGHTRDNDTKWTLLSERIPTMNGAPLDFIPFIPVTTAGLIWDLSYPLINDIAVLNLADYNNEALYRNALMFNGMPTPCVAGLIKDTTNQTSVNLGSSSVLQFETDGKWGTLGGGADAVGLKDSGEDLKNRMALVGSRALAEDPKGVEAVETAMIHRQGEDGLLSAVADSVSMGMTKALEIMRDWWPADVTGDVSYTVNSDFIPGNVDAARLTAVWTMFQSGSISFDTFFSYLQRGEVYADGWSKDDEIEAIEATDEREGAALPIGAEDLGAATTGEAVEAATFTGIQITSANEIIQKVSDGVLSREAGINQLIIFLKLSRSDAELVMGEEVPERDTTTVPSA